MATNLDIYVNADTQDSPINTSGVDWIQMDTTNDEIIISGGSDTVKDGELIPSGSQLNQAGLLLIQPRIEQTYDNYFLADASVGILKQIHNMGDGNYRFVLGFDFDDSTASEPVLELWDNTNLNSISITPLGSGTPSSSWFRGIVTTNSMPGVSWTGNRLAGSSDGYFLWLNDQDGALTGAKTLYCQLRVTLPASQLDAGSVSPIIAVKYATT